MSAMVIYSLQVKVKSFVGGGMGSFEGEGAIS